MFAAINCLPVFTLEGVIYVCDNVNDLVGFVTSMTAELTCGNRKNAIKYISKCFIICSKKRDPHLGKSSGLLFQRDFPKLNN